MAFQIKMNHYFMIIIFMVGYYINSLIYKCLPKILVNPNVKYFSCKRILHVELGSDVGLRFQIPL